MDLLQYLNVKYYLLVPALWVIYMALRQTPKIPNWSIIWILLLLSIVLSTVTFGFEYEAILNGVIATGIAVMGHQFFVQTFSLKKMDQKEKDDHSNHQD